MPRPAARYGYPPQAVKKRATEEQCPWTNGGKRDFSRAPARCQLSAVASVQPTTTTPTTSHVT
jgi:hypothetical protein